MKLAPDIRALLESSGVPWRVVEGKRHMKIVVGNKFCAILPKGPTNRHVNHPGRAQQNTLAQIRRAIREQK